MKRAIILAIVIVAVILTAASITPVYALTERGYLGGTGDSYSFTITSPGPTVDIVFTYPRGSVDFWVSTIDRSGTVSNYDLDNWDSVRLIGTDSFTVTIYSKNGYGNWSAEYEITASPRAPSPTGMFPVSPSVPLSSNPPPGSKEVTISGRLSGPGDTHVFRIRAESSYVEVVFYYPKDTMSLSVRVVGDDKRTVLGQYDLDRGEIIELYGGGDFYLTVRSSRGSGRFMVKFNPAGSPIPQSYIIAQGDLSGGNDSKEFPFEAKTDGISIYFESRTKGAEIWVEVVTADKKRVLGNFNLKSEKIIDLNKKGEYLFSVHSRGGPGSFTAFYFGGPPTETVALGTSPSEGESSEVPLSPKFPPFPDKSKLPLGTSLETGYLTGPGEFRTFIVNARIDYVEVTFSYPKGTTDFWVKVIGEDGIEVLGDFDLDNGEIIQLTGGGIFYLKIYSKEGAGNWSAVYYEGTGDPYSTPNGISNRPRYSY
ncbi:MAG: hypothetical protein L0213_14715 [Candidatus Dadabacteria bacterium]|nr:hypothetical protein [Candidatus Dadabacteria bacterium]